MPLSHRIWLAFFLAFPVIAPIYQWRFPMFGVPTNALEILTILSIGIFIGLITRQRHHASRSEPGVQGSPAERREVWWRCCITKKSLTSPVALLFLAALISLTQATDTFSALGIIKSYIVLPSIVGGITWWVFQNAQARSTLSKYFPYSFALAATWMAYFAFVQVTNPILIPAPWRSELRATGPFPYPNALGHWLAPIAAYSIALLLTRERSLGNRLLLGATVLVSVWGITLANRSRSHCSFCHRNDCYREKPWQKNTLRVSWNLCLDWYNRVCHHTSPPRETPSQRLVWQNPHHHLGGNMVGAYRVAPFIPPGFWPKPVPTSYDSLPHPYLFRNLSVPASTFLELLGRVWPSWCVCSPVGSLACSKNAPVAKS